MKTLKLFLPGIIALIVVICAAYGICITDNIAVEIVLTIIAIIGGGVLGCYVVFARFLDNIPK